MAVTGAVIRFGVCALVAVLVMAGLDATVGIARPAESEPAR